MEEGQAGTPPIRVGRGARQVEAALLDALVAAADAGRREPALLARPIRVIVPSRSLRQHLAAALMRRSERAIAGLVIQTLHGVALEIVERDGAVDASGDALFPILVRRHARAERALRDRLDELRDGYTAVADVVTDLLDAGFTQDHEAALIDVLEACAGPRELVARGCAIVRVAARTLAALAEQGVGHRATLLEAAREALIRDPERALPARRVFVHGFAEATGLRSDLLADLLRYRAAEVFFDEPPDAANPTAEAFDWPFSRRLRDRLAGIGGEVRIGAESEPATLVKLCAHGAEAEVRAVAERILALVEAGQEPERVAVVARDFSGYRTALRRHFDRVGLPFSGVGERGSVGAPRRRAQALLELLQRRGRTPADRWLDAERSDDDPNERSDLRLGLRHVGLVRLEDVAGHSERARDIRLPAVGGWNEGDDESGARVERRTLPARLLARTQGRAKRVARSLAALERRDRLADLLSRTRALLADDLGWEAGDPGCAAVLARIDDLAAELPADFALDFEDFTTLLQRSLADIGTQAIGGAGGGVQVLSVMDARARTFDAVFVLGMNRDVFPRTIRPDPLLPDSVRGALSAVLEDLPIKATGFDEERYLFAQLLSASPAVTLSWQKQTDAGRECAPSTLVDRLAWAGDDTPAENAPALLAARADGRFTADERLTFAGLAADAAAWGEALPVALEDLEQRLPEAARSVDPGAAAAAKCAALAAVNPPHGGVDLLAPHFGFAGEVARDDPRRAAPYVTTLERMARCPWQTFLAKLLRLEAPPDPLLALPGSDPRLLGMVVHAALDRIVAAALPEPTRDLVDARDDDAVRVPWPDAAALDGYLGEAARGVLDSEGIALRGLETVLVEQARPFLERAFALDWVRGAPTVLGSEMNGVAIRRDSSGRPRELHFRADRVDVIAGARVLTDYKTGKPISQGVRPDTRGKAFLTGVLQGTQLQAVAYALAAGADGVGRYLFLRPDLEPATAEFRASPQQSEFADAFDAALGALFEAWDRGAFFPRLLDAKLDKENPACEFCDVAIACVRGDSGQRLRLERGVRAIADADPDSLEAPLRALRALWQLQAHSAETAPREVGE